MCNFKFKFIIIFSTILLLTVCPETSLAVEVSIPFTLSWDMNSETDLAYYRVYYGTSSRDYDSYITVDKLYPSCTLNEKNLIAGLTYYIALTAFDFHLNESGYSDELKIFVEPEQSSTTTTKPGLSTTTTAPVSPTTTTAPVSPTTTTAPDSPTTTTGADSPTTTTEPDSSTTTTTVTIEPKENCSSDDVLKLQGSIPEEGTVTVTLPADIENALFASLILTLFDADIIGEGYIYINDSYPLLLPVDWFSDNLLRTFEFPISADLLVPGENTFRFTHVATMGYEVREVCVKIPVDALSPATTTVSSTSTTILHASTTTVLVSTTTSIHDDTSPEGTVVINNGADITYSSLVTLYISAEDSTSGMGEGGQMSFSNDFTQWSPPEPFSTTKDWMLTTAGGRKTVYAKFCDAAGNWMRYPATDSIMLEPGFDCLKPARLNTTASESSGTFLHAFPKEKAIDGDTNTGWLTPLRFLSMKEEYLTLDLGEAKIINCIDITSKPFLLFNLCPLDFKIQVSLDNIKWSDVVTVEEYSSPPSYSDTWFFDATKARYIKWVITKGRPFLFIFYLSYLSEIEVSGCAATETEPSSAAPAPASTHTKPRVVKSVPGNTPIDNTTPSLNMLKPERPGKPVFLLNNHF
jgi:hypothetical protein